MTTILGLTGSIAMGKSTVLKLFEELGAKVSSADEIVHQLFEKDEELIGQLRERFPEAVEAGIVNRQILGKIVFANEQKLQQLEQLLHPKVRQENLNRIKQAQENNDKLLVLEIPLLFETGAEAICDKVAVVTAPYEIQRARVLAREGMSEEKFQQILARQMPDAEKCKRANFVIDSSNGLEKTKTQLAELMAKL